MPGRRRRGSSQANRLECLHVFGNPRANLFGKRLPVDASRCHQRRTLLTDALRNRLDPHERSSSWYKQLSPCMVVIEKERPLS
jgi:hypothetical protein